MLSNLLIMQIIIPLTAGLISFILPKRFSWGFASIAIAITALISIYLFKNSLNSDAITYHLGGWAPSIGIEYKLDKFNSFFILIVSLASLFNIIAMRSLIANELDQEKLPLFFGIFLFAITGLLGVCISNDIFNIYVLLEVNAIASYALVASGKNSASPKAAFEYLIFGTIGSTLILFGIGFIYALTGSLNLTIISESMPALLSNNAAMAGATLIIFGILMKAALFPLSAWLVNIYQGAPSFISGMLAATSNKVGIYLMLLFYFKVFYFHKYDFASLDIILLFIAVIAIFTCAGLALQQVNIKRFLAYSSLSQIGFIVFSLALASKLAVSGLLIYCLSHAMEKTALFLCAGYLIACSSSEKIEDFAGYIKNNKWVCILIIINLLSTVGFPMTAGFIGKWQILKASLATDLWYIMILLLAILFTFSYAFKLMEILVFRKEDNNIIIHPLLGGKLCLSVISAITILNLYLGTNSQFLLDIANQISQVILNQ